MMLDRPQGEGTVVPWKPARDIMTGDVSGDHRDKARRFHDAALPYLDDVYTLARYLLRDSADAEDAAQECYLRALRYFDTDWGPAMKPWLFAIAVGQRPFLEGGRRTVEQTRIIAPQRVLSIAPPSSFFASRRAIV
jgi:hypothetical protein